MTSMENFNGAKHAHVVVARLTTGIGCSFHLPLL